MVCGIADASPDDGFPSSHFGTGPIFRCLVSSREEIGEMQRLLVDRIVAGVAAYPAASPKSMPSTRRLELASKISFRLAFLDAQHMPTSAKIGETARRHAGNSGRRRKRANRSWNVIDKAIADLARRMSCTVAQRWHAEGRTGARHALYRWRKMW